MVDRGVLYGGRRSLAVLRPVPHPNSVILAPLGGSKEKNWVSSGGREMSSVVWRMLPSVS
jgi:hypothetical protein